MVHVGIDLHLRNMTLVAINDEGIVLSSRKINNNTTELAKFFDQFTGPAQAVVECSNFWYWLADWFRAYRIPLTLAHSKMVKAISYAKVKTDKVDAKTLAELLRVDLLPEAYKIDGMKRDLRELTRGRLRMVKRRRRLQTVIYGIISKYNVSIGQVGWRYPIELKDHLEPRLPRVAFIEAALIVDQICQVQEHIYELEHQIESFGLYAREVQRLLEIPGIANVTAWSIITEVGNIHRFPSSKKFTSYCRLVPGSKNSGDRRRHKSGNKDGNKYLRLAFGQAAISACSNYPVIKKHYQKIKQRSGRQIARTVVGKELAKIVWHVLSKNESYKGYKGQSTKIVSNPYWPQPMSL